MSKLAFTLIVAVCLFGCTNKRQLSEEEIKQIGSLKVELKAVSDELTDAQVDASSYEGLIKTLIILRIQILKTTHALIQERIQAIESDAPITTMVAASAPDSKLVYQLEQELVRQTEAIRVAQKDVGEYDGLLGALKKSSLFTEENTLALLKQRLAIARFGLALPTLPVETNKPASDASVSERVAQQISSQPENAQAKETFQIVSINTRVTESNNVWHKYAWKLILRNQSDDQISCDATIEFLDSDGFVIDDDTEYNLGLNAKGTETFTGYKLINADVAYRVNKVIAKVHLR